MEKKKQGTWKQLSMGNIPEFQRILKLLVEYDERTGRYIKYNEPESHYMRKAASVADPQRLTVILQDRGGYVYEVVASIKSQSGKVVTAWVHEDGIKLERSEAPEGHLLHSIKCLSDLYYTDDVVESPVIDDLAKEFVDK